MADQDFNIRVVTTADTKGIQQTKQGLQEIGAAAKEASVLGSALGAAVGGGVTGVLIGTLISQWREFNNEQERMIENMVKAQEHMRALGQQVIETLDEQIAQEHAESDPLEVTINLMRQKVAIKKQERDLAFAAGEYEDWKKINREIAFYNGLLKNAVSDQERLAKDTERAAAAAEKEAEARRKSEESFYQGAVTSASPQVQAALRQEAAARAAGEGTREADLYQRSAEQFKASMTPAQREEYEGLTKGANQQGVIDAINDLKRDLIGIWR